MIYKSFKKAVKLAESFTLDGKETNSVVDFRFLNTKRNLIRIQSNACQFSRQEIFDFAMILLKAAGEMEEYKP